MHWTTSAIHLSRQSDLGASHFTSPFPPDASAVCMYESSMCLPCPLVSQRCRGMCEIDREIDRRGVRTGGRHGLVGLVCLVCLASTGSCCTTNAGLGDGLAIASLSLFREQWLVGLRLIPAAQQPSSPAAAVTVNATDRFDLGAARPISVSHSSRSPDPRPVSSSRRAAVPGNSSPSNAAAAP